MVKTNLMTANLAVDHFHEPKKEESVYQILENIENSTSNLELVPTILQLLIESFNLESKEELEESEIYDFVARRDMIYETVTLTQNIIFDTLKNLETAINEGLGRMRGDEA